MLKQLNNYAYIDGNNLYRGVNNSGWKIDFSRFRKWLKDKYEVDTEADSYDILLEIGKNMKMLLKKGEIDERRAAVRLLMDWHEGKIKL